MYFKFHFNLSMYSHFMGKMQSVQNEKELKEKKEIILLACISRLAGVICFKFALLGASRQQIWLNLGKRSQSYIGVKIMLFVFLSIY